jgi:hypothetical protein
MSLWPGLSVFSDLAESCNINPGRSGGRVNVKKLVGLLVVALVVFFIVTNPGGASSAVSGLGGWLYGVGQNITSFFSSLAPR